MNIENTEPYFDKTDMNIGKTDMKKEEKTIKLITTNKLKH